MDETPSTEPVIVTETKNSRRRRIRAMFGGIGLMRAVVGTVLILIGLSVLVERLTGVRPVVVPLGIGVLLLTGWGGSRRYSFLLAGSVVTGAGAAILLGRFLPTQFPVLLLLFLSASFLAIRLASGRRSVWAAITSGVLAAVALSLAYLELFDHLPVASGSYTLPIAVILLGVLILFQRAMPGLTRQTFIGILVAVAVLAVSAANWSADPKGRLLLPDFGRPTLEQGGIVHMQSELPTGMPVEVQELPTGLPPGVHRTGNLGVLRITNGLPLIKTDYYDYKGEGGNKVSPVTVTKEVDKVRITIRNDVAAFFLKPIELSLPQGVHLTVNVRSTTVALDLSAASVSINATDATVDVKGEVGDLEIVNTAGPVVVTVQGDAPPKVLVETTSGSVSIHYLGDPTIEVTTQTGSTQAGGNEFAPGGTFSKAGTAGTITVRTVSGNVRLMPIGTSFGVTESGSMGDRRGPWGP